MRTRIVREASALAGSDGAHYIEGIREPLPEGERVLWQGAPSWRALSVRAFHIRKVAIYFGLLLAWRLAASLSDGQTFTAALAASVGLVIVAAFGLGLLALLAWLSARTTIYAITSRRVMLRIGIALPIFVNLPFKGIDGAALRTFGDGTGDLPLQLEDDVRLAWLHLWPHARPWLLKQPQPMLRGLRDPQQVAAVLQGAIAADTQASPGATGRSQSGSSGRDRSGSPTSAQVLPLPPRVAHRPNEAPTAAAA
jgi:hypothetical protein